MARTKQIARKDGKKKGKNAPDRLQPEWMFPADEDNPVLNPKPKSETELAKDKKEWEDAIKFLQHRAHSTPVKPPPPKQLLTLVGAFLTSYGFNNTCRIYQLQCNARNKLEGWDSVLGEKLPKDFPSLVDLYKLGLQTYKEKKRLDETSSSDDEDRAAPNITKRKRLKPEDKANKEEREAAKAEAEQTSSSGSVDDSSDDDDSDTDMKDASTSPKPATSVKKPKTPPLSSSASSSSDSDADDEREKAGLGASSRQPADNQFTMTLKRKTPPSTSLSPNSSSNEEERVPKKAKKGTTEPEVTTGAAKAVLKENSEQQLSKSSSSDSSSSSSSSDSESKNEITVPKLKKPTNESKASSDSSVTLVPTPTTSTSRNDANIVNRTAISSSSSSSISSSSSSDSDSELILASKKSNFTSPTTRITKREVSSPTSPLAESTTTTIKEETSPVTGTITSTTTTTTKKGPKPKGVSFTRIPSDTLIPASLASNAYQPYDYAERAHQDLSVTKGKGFTKEKNKKKRGSYRGGMIDVGPGRAIRFED
ncbi:MAG: hypothetical protein Q9209_004868 [Squamulea sp. 1 TL-2023]